MTYECEAPDIIWPLEEAGRQESGRQIETLPEDGVYVESPQSSQLRMALSAHEHSAASRGVIRPDWADNTA